MELVSASFIKVTWTQRHTNPISGFKYKHSSSHVNQPNKGNLKLSLCTYFALELSVRHSVGLQHVLTCNPESLLTVKGSRGSLVDSMITISPNPDLLGSVYEVNSPESLLQLPSSLLIVLSLLLHWASWREELSNKNEWVAACTQGIIEHPSWSTVVMVEWWACVYSSQIIHVQCNFWISPESLKNPSHVMRCIKMECWNS